MREEELYVDVATAFAETVWNIAEAYGGDHATVDAVHMAELITAGILYKIQASDALVDLFCQRIQRIKQNIAEYQNEERIQ